MQGLFSVMIKTEKAGTLKNPIGVLQISPIKTNYLYMVKQWPVTA